MEKCSSKKEEEEEEGGGREEGKRKDEEKEETEKWSLCSWQSVILGNHLQCYWQHQHTKVLYTIGRERGAEKVSQGATDSFNLKREQKDFWYREGKHINKNMIWTDKDSTTVGHGTWYIRWYIR